MKNIVLNADDIEKKIRRLSYQIIEKNINKKNITSNLDINYEENSFFITEQKKDTEDIQFYLNPLALNFHQV